MNAKVIIASFVLLFLMAGAQAATPTVYDFNIGANGPAYTNTATMNLYLSADGNATHMRFSCISTFSMSRVTFNTSYPNFSLISGNNCVDSDGTKTVYAEVCSADNDQNCATAITDTIILDRSAPTTSDDYNDQWKNTTFNITLSCNDGTSGCSNTQYRKDTDSSSSISYSAWQTYSSAISISSDGNFAIDYNSTDNAGNIETTKTIYALRDTISPSITINTPSNGSTVTAQTVAFDVNYTSNAPINLNTIRVDLNGSTSSAFDKNNHCTAFGNDYACSYTETGLLTGNQDYNVTVYAQDSAGNQTQSSSIFHYNDNTAPTSSPTPIVYSPCAGSTIINWTAQTSPADLNGYKIFRGGYATFDANHQTLIGFASKTTASYTDSTTTADNNYWYRLRSVDYSDNNATQSSAAKATTTTCTTPSSPTISSSTHTHNTWSSSDDVTLTWSSVSGITAYRYKFDTSASNNLTSSYDSISSSGSRQYTASDKADGTYYFHVSACNGSACGSVSNFTIKIDDTSPGTPSNLSTSVSNDDVTLSWSAASDSTSGVQYYYIYRSTSSGFTPSSSNRISTTATGTSYSDNDRSNDTYYYKISAVDYAGNEGSVSSQTSATVSTSTITDDGCDFTINIDVPSSIKAKTVTITVSGDSMTNPNLKVKVYGKGYGDTFSTYTKSGSHSSFSNSYAFTSAMEGEATVFVTARDNDDDSCSATKKFIVDTTTPTISWKEPLANEKLKGSVWLKAEAEDKTDADKASGIEKVSFYYGDAKITSTSAHTGNVYSANWDVSNLENGTYTLKAKTTDDAGNSSETTLTVVIENLTEGQKAAKTAIEAAETNKIEVEAIIEFMNNQNLAISDTLSSLKAEADALLAEAKADFADEEKADDAESKAKQASEKYTSIKESNKAEVTETEAYEFDKENLEALFSGIGLQEALLAEAIDLANESEVSRTLNIIEIVEDDQTTYGLSMILTFTNNSSSAQDIQLIEVIPKSFAANASSLFSNMPFTVIEEDPVIKFDIGEVAAGEAVEIIYGLSEALSKEKAEEMISQKVINQFKAPPIVLDANTTFLKGAVASTATGWDLDFILMAAIVVIIIAIILVAAVGTVKYLPRGKGPPGKKKAKWAFAEGPKGHGKLGFG